jgi:hypothetical protein
MARISDFKSQMSQGGLRLNQFRCEITFPQIVQLGAQAGQKLQFLAKGAQAPASNMADVVVNYRGRPVHFAGEREFEPWTIDVYTDTDMVVRNAFESWINVMQNTDSTAGIQQPGLYQIPMSVIMTDRNDRSVKKYTFQDAFPVSVGALQLDWDANNQIAIFPVTFQYNYWTADGVQGIQA